MTRVGFVIHRFGNGFPGGSEALALALARKMQEVWDITVFTSCSRNYHTWENHYPAGKSVEDGIEVWRFPVNKPRDFQRFSDLLNKKFQQKGPLDFSLEEENWFFEEQGPLVPTLVEELHNQYNNYDFFIFFTLAFFEQ